MDEENGGDGGTARDVTKVSWRVGTEARRPDWSFLKLRVCALTICWLPSELAECLREGE